jgi:hypothetical protein
MKTLSAYFHETKKVYEFRIKLAHVEPKGEVLDRIKSALNAFQVESVSPVKRLPITEHWEFAKEGACECYVVDIGVRYPSIPGQLRQLIGERAGINASWVCVKTMAEALNEELNYEQADSNEAHKGALLDDPELASMPSNEAQQYVGQGRLTGLIKELSANTRKFEIQGTDNEYASGKTTNDNPQITTSPIGSTKNTLQNPRGK